jgi:hypothetical protein
MTRISLLALLSTGAFVAFTAVPAALFDSGTAGVSASAATNFNSSRSNIYRKKAARPQTQQGDPAGLAVSDPGAPGGKGVSSGKGNK